MTIQKVELSDKFHVWVAATNQVINELNNNIVLEARQKLKTTSKTTIIDAINEIHDKSVNKDENLNIDRDINANTISAKINIRTGSAGLGNSYIEFFDDTNDMYRKLVYNHIEDNFYVENQKGELIQLLKADSTINGNQNKITIKQLSHSENLSYIGQIGEFVYDTTLGELYIHDGVTAGGLIIPIRSNDKVKTDENDPNSGYLEDKLKAGTGIKVTKNDNKIYVSSSLYDQFPSNHTPNTYLKRNNANNLYDEIGIEQIKQDLNLDNIIDQIRQDLLNSLFSVGDIKASLRTENHGNWILCNGQKLVKTDYPELYKVIGTKFGWEKKPGSWLPLLPEESDIYYIYVPDYRGKFLRGLGGDSADNFQTIQNEGLPNITGQTQAQDGYLRTPNASGAFQTILTNGSSRSGDGGQSAAYSTFDASRSNSIYGASNHVTPINMAVNYFIKAK